MHVVIDGYNLIRQSLALRQAERQSLEEGRRALLSAVNDYQRFKGHRVTVVFDGWAGGTPEEGHDRYGDVDVIYSPLGEKADEVIKRIVARRDDDFVVVSSDRAVALFAINRGYAAIASLEFEARLCAAQQEDATEGERESEESAGDAGGATRIGTKKRGSAYRLSRVQRRKKSILKRL